MYKFYYTNGYGVTSYTRKSITSLWQIAWNPNIRKWLMRINLTCLILLVAFMQVSLAANAQKISLSKKNVPLTEIFKELRKQTGYDFVINKEQIKISKPVSIQSNGIEMVDALNKCFEGQPFTYRIEDKMIVVVNKRQEQTKIELLQIEVNGRVADVNGLPLSGASIKVKGTSLTTTSNEKGEFALNKVDDNAILQISYIGYETREMMASKSMTITLSQSISALTEISVVSTGYQILPKERATGSFGQPIKEMFDSRVSTDVLSKLSGITSGLLFNSNTLGTASGNLDMNIRGRSTIFANDQPLIVVDNFPYNGDMSNINPNDVLNITVLKDAAAASIWGVRAGNGVIVITTKQGKFGQPLKVGFNTNLTIANKPNLNYNSNQLKSSDYIDLEQFLFNKGYYDAYLNDNINYPSISPVVEYLASQRAGEISVDQLSSRLNLLRSSNANDQVGEYFYQKAVNQQYAINLSGGSNKATYYFSAGYDNNIPNLTGNKFQRITLNSQNVYQPFKHLLLNVGLNVIQAQTNKNNTLSNTLSYLLPYSQFTNADGLPISISSGYRSSFVETAPTKGFLDWSFNPIHELHNKDDVAKSLNIRLTTGLKYSFLKGLDLDVKYQYERSNNQERNLQNQNSYFARNLINQFSVLTSGNVTGYNVPLGGILNLQNGNSISNNIRTQLSYNQIWEKHAIAAIAGYELSQVRSESNSSLLYGYNDNVGTFSEVNTTSPFDTNPSGNRNINGGLGIGGTLDRFRSSFANLAYTYNEIYTISGSARIDGSNYFGVATNQKNVPLWSIGAKWIVDKEKFYQSEWLPSLSLRATYGFSGNLDRSVTGVTTFQFFNDPFYFNLPYAFISNLGNPDLKWEKTGTTNFGIDFGIYRNIISGSLDYYFKKGTDVLGYKNFATNAGIASLKGNYSDMKGHGFDFSITSRNLDEELKWATTFLFSYATDKVTRYDVMATTNLVVATTGSTSEAVPVVGKPVFGLYSYKWAGLNPSTGNPIGYLDGKQSEDYQSITSRTPIEDLIYSGSARPRYFGGINNHFSYKGFNLDIQVNYKIGYFFRKPTINYSNITATGGALRVNKDYVDRWQKTGDENITNVPSMIYPSSSTRDNFYQFSEVNIEKGDHIRLQDVSFSYDFIKKVFPKLPFNNLQLYLYSNNIGILWRANKKGIDPDAVASFGDVSTTTASRSISFGIKGTF